MNNIDLILYEKGDIVIRKNKSEDVYGNIPKAETVIDTKIIETERYYYQILYFESNPDSGYVALEYEPYDLEAKAAYYSLDKSMKKNKINKTKPSIKKDDANNTSAKNIKHPINPIFL